jgi:hypothetical protein
VIEKFEENARRAADLHGRRLRFGQEVSHADQGVLHGGSNVLLLI